MTTMTGNATGLFLLEDDVDSLVRVLSYLNVRELANVALLCKH